MDHPGFPGGPKHRADTVCIKILGDFVRPCFYPSVFGIHEVSPSSNPKHLPFTKPDSYRSLCSGHEETYHVQIINHVQQMKNVERAWTPLDVRKKHHASLPQPLDSHKVSPKTQTASSLSTEASPSSVITISPPTTTDPLEGGSTSLLRSSNPTPTTGRRPCVVVIGLAGRTPGWSNRVTYPNAPFTGRLVQKTIGI